MPYAKIQTNENIEVEEELLQGFSALIANELGKPESYVMTALETVNTMTMGGKTGPAAFIEVKSIGLSRETTDELSRVICQFLNKELGLDEKRVYINFADVEGSYWGWKGTTF